MASIDLCVETRPLNRLPLKVNPSSQVSGSLNLCPTLGEQCCVSSPGIVIRAGSPANGPITVVAGHKKAQETQSVAFEKPQYGVRPETDAVLFFVSFVTLCGQLAVRPAYFLRPLRIIADESLLRLVAGWQCPCG